MPLRVIGVLGGSFDPIHAGHLQLARDALAQLPIDEIRFMPADQPWQKGALTAAVHRAHMVELAIAGEPKWALDMHEIERGGATYTIETLRALRGVMADASLVLIMGSDQFERFDTWREWQAITELAHIAVAQRAGIAPSLNRAVAALHQERHCAPTELGLRVAGCITEFSMTPVDVSATEVRRLLGTGSPEATRRLREVVPQPVLDYIHSNRLYA